MVESREVIMLEQEKIGKYIAEKRKGIGLTQKELAERVGLTDKAVSKWERGKSIPDHDVITRLCEVLNISVNEFLSGEDIVSENYSEKAEENMISLIKDKKNTRYEFLISMIILICGIVFVILDMYSMSNMINDDSVLVHFVDLPSLLFVTGVTAVLLVVTGMGMDFIHAFASVFRINKKHIWNVKIDEPIQTTSTNDIPMNDVSTNEMKTCTKDYKVYDIELTRELMSLKLAAVTNILAGIIHFVSGIIILFPNYDNAPDIKFWSILSIHLLSVWYALVLDIILVPIYFKLKCKREELCGQEKLYRQEECCRQEE